MQADLREQLVAYLREIGDRYKDASDPGCPSPRQRAWLTGVAGELLRRLEIAELEDAAAHDDLGVHAAHCCAEHGCRYGEDDCPVVAGRVKQDGPCDADALAFEAADWRATTEDRRTRDGFAAAALQGLLAHHGGDRPELGNHVNRARREGLASQAWAVAEAMMKVRGG